MGSITLRSQVQILSQLQRETAGQSRGLFTRWFHRGGLIAGWAVGMTAALVLLYQIPKKDAAGTVLKAHFGGSGYPLSNFAVDTQL